MPTNRTALTQRNGLIVKQLNEGASVPDVAGLFSLTPAHVRRIRSEYAAAPAATKNDSNGNGTGASGSMGELGVSGLKYSHGYIQEEFLRELNSPAKRYKIYNEMRSNEPIIGASLLAIELTLRGMEWRIDGDDDERREFIETARTDTAHSWNAFISEVLTMIAHGWSYFETVYKRREGPEAETRSNYSDGKIGWHKFAFRSQDSLHSWVFDERGNVQGMNQLTFPDYKMRTIPLTKALLFRTTTEKNNPEGRSFLRTAYPSYYYATNLKTIEAIGAERDLAGMPTVTLPEGADTSSEDSSDVAKAKALVRNVRQDEQGGIVKPFGWEFELLGAPGSKQFNVGEIIARYEKRMAMAFMAQFLMLGMDGTGSYALSKDQSDFFVGVVNAIADMIAETFSQHAILPLLKLNGMAMDNPPTLAHGPVGTPDLQAVQQFFGGLTAYIKPDVELEQHLRQLADAPEISEEEIARREAEQERMASIRPDPTAQQTDQQIGPDGKPVQEMPMEGEPMPAQQQKPPPGKRKPPPAQEKVAA